MERASPVGPRCIQQGLHDHTQHCALGSDNTAHKEIPHGGSIVGSHEDSYNSLYCGVEWGAYCGLYCALSWVTLEGSETWALLWSLYRRLLLWGLLVGWTWLRTFSYYAAYSSHRSPLRPTCAVLCTVLRALLRALLVALKSSLLWV